MNRLVNAVQNVRYARHAMRWGAVGPARELLECARLWLMWGYDGSPRALKVLALVNLLAIDLIWTEVAMAPPVERHV